MPNPTVDPGLRLADTTQPVPTGATTGLTGAGASSQASALATQPGQAVQFSTAAANTGYQLPSISAQIIGVPYFVRNDGASPLTVYPNINDSQGANATINGAASFSVTNGKMAVFVPMALGKWYAMLSA